jgi:hypothetical protein
MIEKRSPFYAYRYLVSPINDQITITQQLSKSKEELMTDIIHNLAVNTKTEWTKGNKRYLFYGFQNKNNIYIIKYAKETNEKIYLEGDSDIEIKGIKEAKYVFVIIDTVHQIILLEKNVSVFQSMNNAIATLADFFRTDMRHFDYAVNIYPLASKKKFWNYVDTADEIFELSLVMNAPNLAFFGHEDTRDILQQIKETTNNEEFDISFKNKEGKLKIVKSALGSWIDYVREVGGKYLLKFAKNGVIETKTSETDTAKAYIERKKAAKYSDEEIRNIADKLDAIDKLESRDDDEEEI